MSTIKFYYSFKFLLGAPPKINFRDYFFKILSFLQKRHNEHLLCFLSLFSSFYNCWRNSKKKYFLSSLASNARLFLKLQLFLSNAACNLAVGENMKKRKRHFWLAISLFLKLCVYVYEGKNRLMCCARKNPYVTAHFQL